MSDHHGSTGISMYGCDNTPECVEATRAVENMARKDIQGIEYNYAENHLTIWFSDKSRVEIRTNSTGKLSVKSFEAPTPIKDLKDRVSVLEKRLEELLEGP